MSRFTRRRFIQGAAAMGATFLIQPGARRPRPADRRLGSGDDVHALGTNLGTLAPLITPYTAPGATTPLPLTQLIPAAGANSARCEANFIYSDRGGPAAGYAVDRTSASASASAFR